MNSTNRENAIHPGRMALGTLGYLVLTFPLAYIWHLVVFEQTYLKLGYFSRDEPIIAFGFGSILIQGILLSVIYPFLCRSESFTRNVAFFVLVMGGYHWTMHVLAEAAKHDIAPLSTWFALETLYLFIQFLNGGILLALIYRRREGNSIA